MLLSGNRQDAVDEAAAIVYAVDHGAKVINLSIGGEGSSIIEKRAVDYAANRNVLLVAAGGNEYEDGNPIEYPAALLQPPGSRGQGGVGLVVAAVMLDDAPTSSKVGLNVIAGIFGSFAVAAFRAIHGKRVPSTWLLLGVVPTAIGLFLTFG